LAFPAQAAGEESLPQQTVALPPLRRVHSLHFPAPAGIPNNDNLAHERKDVTTMSTAPPTPEHILQTGLAFWASKTLLSAVEMEVFTELAKGPESLQALTGRLGLHPRASRDFLDALVALGFLERRDGSYSNTPSTDLFLDKHKPSYIGGMLEMANKRLFHHWGKLTTALRTGERQSEQPGEAEVFAALYADPTRLKGFLRAMTGISRGANVAIATQFPWAKYKTATDCGTAQGDLIVQIARKNSHIAGTGFDLPEVAPIFEEYVEANGLSSRVKFQPGSFFTDPLPRADVILMGHILHDWDLDEKKMLIRKAYEAIPEGGAFIAYDALIDDDRSKNAFGLLMSLNMLIETPGGFDYTGADCVGWMKEAGFREIRVEHLVGPDSMVVGIK
jgi:O-methyltransferase domain/Dimerisation domain